MLINRESLIKTLEASNGSQFRSLVCSLKSHRLKDLTLTNVLLEAQTFQILPYALKSMHPKSEMLNPDLTDVLTAWVFTVGEGVKDARRDPYHQKVDDLDEELFAQLREGKSFPDAAVVVIDHLLKDVCEHCEMDDDSHKKPNRKNVFYTFCRMLDNVMLQRQLHYHAVSAPPVAPIAYQ